MIQLNHVNISYDQPILQDLNLEFLPGQITAVIGANGSGKSTLAQVLAGLKLDFTGEIKIDNRILSRKLPIHELRQLVGLVLQQPEHQIIFDRVDLELSFALENLRLPHTPIKLKNTLKTVGLDLPLDANPWQLSGGQKQRLVLASQLALALKYLILDEATSMLDYPGRQLLYRVLEKLKHQNLGIIMLTNQLDEILLADKIIILANGTARVFSKQEILGQLDLLTKFGLSIPPLLRLAAKLQVDNFSAIDEWLKEGHQKC